MFDLCSFREDLKLLSLEDCLVKYGVSLKEVLDLSQGTVPIINQVHHASDKFKSYPYIDLVDGEWVVRKKINGEYVVFGKFSSFFDARDLHEKLWGE